MPTVHSFSNASAHAAKLAAVEIADGFGDFGLAVHHERAATLAVNIGMKLLVDDAVPSQPYLPSAPAHGFPGQPVRGRKSVDAAGTFAKQGASTRCRAMRQ
ncbi:hypothetical protein ABFV80_002105 [Vandammella animalimorsus]|uniref:hypothetical protein n=1 Tax=Vandammella animalimorsus TaxID=2029117 RepID=UPI00325B5C55